jgi:hypothetical protein
MSQIRLYQADRAFGHDAFSTATSAYNEVDLALFEHG